MGVITLITDFGLKDEYAGVMKGAILSVNSGVQVVDVCHNIDPFDKVAAARMAKTSYKYFPDRTVHVIVVDPGVGSSRAIVAFEMDGHFFLCPDNGIPSFLIAGNEVADVVRVENREFFPGKVSPTFHGRDIFAKIAARISGGTDYTELGPQILVCDLVSFDEKGAKLEPDGTIIGCISSIDHFGNLITNISEDMVNPGEKLLENKRIFVEIKGKRICGVSDAYHAVPEKEPVALIGSRGYLEIAVNCASAKGYFNSKVGDLVRIIQE